MQIISLDRIEAHLDSGSWLWAVENRARIEENWARRLVEKPAIFNGIVLVCTQLSIEGNVLKAHFREAEYASYLAMHDFGFPEPSVCNCFGAAVIRGSDGSFILGEMAPHTANGGRVYFPGGSLDRADVREDGSIDVDGSIRRELMEEVGINSDDLTFEKGWTVVRNGHHTALLKQAFSPLSGAELKGVIQKFLDNEADPELSDIRLVRSLADIDPTVMPFYVSAYIKGALSKSFDQVG